MATFTGRVHGTTIDLDVAATAETVNADLRNRTISRFTVRGRAKVRAVALLAALTYNLLRAARLRAPT